MMCFIGLVQLYMKIFIIRIYYLNKGLFHFKLNILYNKDYLPIRLLEIQIKIYKNILHRHNF